MPSLVAVVSPFIAKQKASFGVGSTIGMVVDLLYGDTRVKRHF